jgi:predicted nucleotidyltransferase component of viral defense system
MDIRAKIVKDQKRITKMVTGEFPVYYLAGGTALAFYLRHRFSEDLDFFSPAYDPVMANKIMRYIKT